MSNMPSFFSSYSICFEKDNVCITDGSYYSVAGKGCILITSTLPLSFVLHAPNFTLNLLSVYLTKSLDCSVTCFPSHCVFQDFETKMMIGGGHEENNGLYILDVPSCLVLPMQQFSIT